MTLVSTALAILLYCCIASAQLSGTEPCPPGSFIDPSRGCILCPPGQYNPRPDRNRCQLCPFGTFRSTPGAISPDQCRQCPADTFSAGGAKSCSPCAEGTISPPGVRRCGVCGPGFELVAAGDTVSRPGPCVKCESGLISTGAQNRKCERCPDGTFARGTGKTECIKCPPGTFRRNTPVTLVTEDDSERSEKCYPCQENTFSPGEGAPICKLCPIGTVSKRGATECTPCPKDTFSRFNTRFGKFRCQACPAGTSSKGIRPAGCKDPKTGCPAGTFEGKSGECEACRPGERLEKKSGKCIPCPSNAFSNGGDETNCQKCPRGKVPLGDETVFEGSGCECVPGTVDDQEGGCIPCPKGYYWERVFFQKFFNENLERETSLEPGFCTECPIGSFNDKVGSTTCKPCPEGTFQDQEASSTCTKCPAGTESVIAINFFETVPVPTACINPETACPPGDIRVGANRCEGKVCPPGFALIRGSCGTCDAGQVYDKKEQRCRSCPEDSVSDGGAQTKCVKCPENSVRNVIAPRQCVCRTAFSGGPTNIGLLGGKCQECPPGLVSEVFAGQARCYRCPSGTFEDVLGGCADCGRNSFTEGPGATQCIRCPKGTSRPRTLLGELLNECI